MARKKNQDGETSEGGDAAEASTTSTAAEGSPQGIVPQRSEKPHPTFAKRGIMLIDPASLRVPKKNAAGEEYLDDPYLAFPKPGGGVAVSQVGAEHAALLLTCDPLSGGNPTCRLATDAEVDDHKKVHGYGGHGNIRR